MAYRSAYYTADELNFLRELRERNPEAFRKYAAIVMGDLRVYPESVDVRQVVAAIREMSGSTN